MLYTSGNPEIKSDFYVEFTPAKSGGIKIDIHSTSKVLHGLKLEHTSLQVITDLNIKHGKLLVIDNGGQYFVLQARIESAVKSANPNMNLESLRDIKKLFDQGINSLLDKLLKTND